MAFVFTNDYIGAPPIASTQAATLSITQGATTVYPASAVGRAPGTRLGMVAEAYDPTYGQGEFIYLLGVASTVVGSMVVWDGASSGTPTYQTALCPSTGGLGQPVAFAMSANVAGQYGWYQVSGSCVAATNGTLAAGPGPVYIGTTGTVTSTQAAGKQIVNARNDTATGTPAANQAVLLIQRPFAQGQIL